MRLICPKCDAQYDIADDVIPEGGRDVQCSSCSHTWFQMDKPKIAGRPLTQAPKPRPMTGPTGPAVSDGPRHKPVEDMPRKPLDSSIADILREEAAREKEVQATEEAQPHPNERTGQTARERAEQTRQRISRIATGDEISPAAVAAASTGAVHGANVRTMPGIDEINATLQARAQASDTSGLTEEEHVEVVKRRGFRRGFFMVLLLMAILITPYFFADQITENLPQTQDIMNSYVATVDQLRLWLNDQIQAVQGMVEDMMAPDEAAPAVEGDAPATE